MVARGDTAPTPLDVSPITMTLVKFAATVLPTLESLKLRMGEGADQYVALVTAVYADSPRSFSGAEWTTATRLRQTASF